MKKLLNVLYVTHPESYLMLDGETIIIKINNDRKVRVPLHNLESIICFNYMGISPALMGKCVECGILISFLTPYGKYLASVNGNTKGSILVRKKQYQISNDSLLSLNTAKTFIIAKIHNSRANLERFCRDYPTHNFYNEVKQCSEYLKGGIEKVKHAKSFDELRGIEGDCAKNYFNIFDHLIIAQKDSFYIKGRTRRPPLDNVNALLSFLYTLLSLDVQSALESSMLDSYAGILHTDRPGRASLALDLMEEMRPYLVDRFVLTLINLRIVNKNDFIKKDNGAIILIDDARSKILQQWQKRKEDKITHPFTNEKISIGLIPYVQATLFGRYIRGDLDGYPPFLVR